MFLVRPRRLVLVLLGAVVCVLVLTITSGASIYGGGWIDSIGAARLAIATQLRAYDAFRRAAPQCAVATAGGLLVVDDRGAVCERFAIERAAHGTCCPSHPHALQCSTCVADLELRRTCCELYEYCAACCMRHHGERDRGHAPDGAALLPHRPSAARSRNYTAFAWCTLSCRTNSRTMNDGPDRHCVFDMPEPDPDRRADRSGNGTGTGTIAIMAQTPSRTPSPSGTPVPAAHWAEF